MAEFTDRVAGMVAVCFTVINRKPILNRAVYCCANTRREESLEKQGLTSSEKLTRLSSTIHKCTARNRGFLLYGLRTTSSCQRL